VAATSTNVLVRQYAADELVRLNEDQSKITAIAGQG
jgi:hypothetical protein